MLVRSSLNAVRQFATSAARRGHDPAVMPGYPPPASVITISLCLGIEGQLLQFIFFLELANGKH